VDEGFFGIVKDFRADTATPRRGAALKHSDNVVVIAGLDPAIHPLE
jgi:hypothetical protein